jgi:hypothetical protein
MRRAWRWYWRTIGEGWARKDKRQRQIMVWVLLASAAFYSGLTVVIAFVPSVRVPVLFGLVIFLPLESIVAGVIRSRKRRGRSTEIPPR